MEENVKKLGRPFRKDINYRQETKLVRLSPASYTILNGLKKQSMDHAVKHVWKLLMQKGKLLKAQEKFIKEQNVFIDKRHQEIVNLQRELRSQNPERQ